MPHSSPFPCAAIKTERYPSTPLIHLLSTHALYTTFACSLIENSMNAVSVCPPSKTSTNHHFTDDVSPSWTSCNTVHAHVMAGQSSGKLLEVNDPRSVDLLLSTTSTIPRIAQSKCLPTTFSTARPTSAMSAAATSTKLTESSLALNTFTAMTVQSRYSIDR